MASLGKIAANVAKVTLLNPNKHLLRSLESDSDIMEKQRETFTTVSQHFPVACLSEEKSMGVLGLVSRTIRSYKSLQ